MNWTEEDIDRLRQLWGTMPGRKVAELMNRPYGSVRAAAKNHRLTGPSRAWSRESIDLVKKLYATHTGKQIAVQIGKTEQKVWDLIARLKLPRKWPSWPQEILDRVRALHAKGLTDADIARRMPDFVPERVFEERRRAVHSIRLYRLKLPMNRDAVKAAGRRAVKNQLKTLGLTSPTQLRTRAYQNYARENGFPEDLPPRCVQTLNILAERGPMTLQEMTVAIGMRDRGPKHWLHCNLPGGTCTAVLIRRGLVHGQKRFEAGRGRGKSRQRNIYTLTAAAIELLEARVAKEKANGERTRLSSAQAVRSPGPDAQTGRDRSVRREVAGGCVSGGH